MKNILKLSLIVLLSMTTLQTSFAQITNLKCDTSYKMVYIEGKQYREDTEEDKIYVNLF
jgi:hypothetical protein